jgi:hypothetical protein
MADIELVVKIPEEMYAEIMDENGIETMLIPYSSIVRNGVPLPKGHGRLIDADALIDILGCSDRDIYAMTCVEEDALTIIEADKGE